MKKKYVRPINFEFEFARTFYQEFKKIWVACKSKIVAYIVML